MPHCVIHLNFWKFIEKVYERYFTELLIIYGIGAQPLGRVYIYRHFALYLHGIHIVAYNRILSFWYMYHNDVWMMPIMVFS